MGISAIRGTVELFEQRDKTSTFRSRRSRPVPPSRFCSDPWRGYSTLSTTTGLVICRDMTNSVWGINAINIHPLPMLRKTGDES
jgi:hypothetical protein